MMLGVVGSVICVLIAFALLTVTTADPKYTRKHNPIFAKQQLNPESIGLHEHSISSEEMQKETEMRLTNEQKKFVKKALSGGNILVDACVGSGKTTAIQCLCNKIPEDKNVLYLTYNRLLKIDAQQRILNHNVHVQNYHGYASEVLNKHGIHNVAIDEILSKFNDTNNLQLPHVDILILDEYQDIDSEIAGLLNRIKKSYTDMQIVMVGDIAQKIYDHTTLNVTEFCSEYLGDYETIQFTKCFRLPERWSKSLGITWGKEINGVNPACKIVKMTESEVVDFLSWCDPKDILCLGPRRSAHSTNNILNQLECRSPERFNKHTVYSSIRDKDENIKPGNDCAIFTTYDSCKGLERKICVLCGWTDGYFNSRKRHERYEILRNIFCVAASRGKEKIIIVDYGDGNKLSWKTLRTPYKDERGPATFAPVTDFVKNLRTEELTECQAFLSCTDISNAKTKIDIARQDGQMDLSPCVGIYAEGIYFDNYDIDEDIKYACRSQKVDVPNLSKLSFWEKTLYLTCLETGQERYRNQADKLRIDDHVQNLITKRLSERLQADEMVQVGCAIDYEQEGSPISIQGICDVIKDNTAYELKYVSSLSREHFLQCACYILALRLKRGVLWNLMTNECIEIQIRNRKALLDKITELLTGGAIKSYIGPLWTDADQKQKEEAAKAEKAADDKIIRNYIDCHKKSMALKTAILANIGKAKVQEHNSPFAIIDTETTWADTNLLQYGNKYIDAVFSIGVVIADGKTFEVIDALYFIIDPECTENGFYKHFLTMAPESITQKASRIECIATLRSFMDGYKVHDILAYNASFDRRHLPELHDYVWRDIAKKAAYIQYNPCIDKENNEICKTGRLKYGYGVESMYQILTGDDRYYESHNALYDAMDELEIMKRLAIAPGDYPGLDTHTPKANPKTKEKYIGQSRMMNNGHTAKITTYNHYDDVTVEFEDGTVKEHCRIDNWKNGKIAHPVYNFFPNLMERRTDDTKSNMLV